jgi:HAD superfamily hydrolase (TIGR01509 family)
MDGVVTDTARVHARCWKGVFDRYLRSLTQRTSAVVRPFDIEDYLDYVDGKPRQDGAQSFLTSRGIDLPLGAPSDSPGFETVFGLANLKDSEFQQTIEHEGVTLFASTATFIHSLRSLGIRTALISSSRHTAMILATAGVTELFDVVVDGIEADAMDLPGKPDPAIFLAAALQLDALPSRTAVVEDALAGVEAGRRGGFCMVVGVDRTGHADALRRHGADIVVADLSQLELHQPIATELP